MDHKVTYIRVEKNKQRTTLTDIQFYQVSLELVVGILQNMTNFFGMIR